ncbi:PAR14-like protein, partial [Mya arenaria]
MHSNYHQKWYSDSATGGPVERIPGVVDQWERIDIFYRNTGSEARKEWIHALDTPILQYIISKKGKRIKDAFDTQDSTQDEISQILKEKFEKEIVRDVESMAVKVSANVTDRIKSKLRNLSLETEKLKAVYFDTKNGYLTCVADNDSHLNELLMDIGYEDEEKIRLNDISAQVLQDLQFEQAVKTSHPRLKCITFADENDSVTLLWQGKKETSGSELLAKFKGKIRDCVVLENAINAKHIVFNTRAGGRVNDTFVEYIKEMTKQSLNTPAIPLFTFDFSLKRITLYTLDNVKAIQEIVNQSIIERQLDPETAKHFFKGGSSLDFCKKATDERKLLYDININGIVCIKSVQKDLDDLINQAIPYKEEPLDLSELQVSFLKQYGSQLMEQVEKRYDIAVKLENNRCLFRGKDSQLLQKGKEFMVDSLKKLLTHMSIKTNEVAVLKLKEGIENVVAENNCKWNLNFTNEFCNTDLNKYLGAWHDPLAHIITCVQNVDNGDMVAADLVIELTTSNLFPLSKHFTKENPLVGRSTAGKIFSVMHEEILEGPFQKDAFCCQSMFAFVICSSYSPGMQYQFISFQQLKKCYLRALQYADENGMKSLALSTKLLQSPALENDITPAILAAAFEFVEANHQHDIRKLTLCCDKENCHDVCDTVENLYDKRKGYRRILSLPSEPNKQNAVISLNVKVGSITDSKRDVIVNTVNIKLDFAKGQVSKKILEKAGPEMQRECNQKYPNGISYDQIAYTCSYNISYTGNTVKCFVKRCLYLADRLDCKTLVFPAIGVGKLDYPRRETATAMFEAIEEYPKEAANCGIQEVDIMVFNGDQKSCMNFRDEEWRKLKGGAKHRPKLAEMNEVEAGSMGIKSASKPPKSWNDQIDVCVKCADIQSIDFKKLGKVLFEERITEVFFIADKKDDLPLSEQVIQIANLIKQLSKNPNEVVQLKTCTVFVDEHVEETVMAKGR